MTSRIDIYNKALSEIGVSPIASPDEASEEARQCNLWWDAVRRNVLRAAFWPSCRKEVLLTPQGDGTGQGGWTYAYTYPPDCVLARYIVAQNGRWPPFTVSTVPVVGGNVRVILTNVTEPKLAYVADLDDPSHWDPLLEQAVVSALAAAIAYELTGKRTLRAELIDKANGMIMQARSAAAKEMRHDITSVPSKVVAMNEWDDLVFDASPYVNPEGPLLR